MEKLSFAKRLIFSFTGRIYAFAYFSQRRTFLAVRRSSWYRFLIVILFAVSFILRWSLAANITFFCCGCVWDLFIGGQSKLGTTNLLWMKRPFLPPQKTCSH
ncbi:MAG: hypothetical protein GY805_37530 [Chloroflexi bacterium]|nr:hypothetical protein [Chloroflexota bacterium]